MGKRIFVAGIFVGGALRDWGHFRATWGLERLIHHGGMRRMEDGGAMVWQATPYLRVGEGASDKRAVCGWRQRGSYRGIGRMVWQATPYDAQVS
jgi:hypothetical protein